MSDEAREFAEGALMALSDRELVALADGEQKHIMLSYQWSSQRSVQRLNDYLLNLGYLTWYDLTNMKGSTMDAMRCGCCSPPSSFSPPSSCSLLCCELTGWMIG